MYNLFRIKSCSLLYKYVHKNVEEVQRALFDSYQENSKRKANSNGKGGDDADTDSEDDEGRKKILQHTRQQCPYIFS